MVFCKDHGAPLGRIGGSLCRMSFRRDLFAIAATDIYLFAGSIGTNLQ